jgi:hypothetical protein
MAAVHRIDEGAWVLLSEMRIVLLQRMSVISAPRCANSGHNFRSSAAADREEIRLVGDDHPCPPAQSHFILFQLFPEHPELVPGRGARKIHDGDERVRAFHGPQKRVSEPDVVRCVLDESRW